LEKYAAASVRASVPSVVEWRGNLRVSIRAKGAPRPSVAAGTLASGTVSRQATVDHEGRDDLWTVIAGAMAFWRAMSF
jgi:hypothetical protein